METSRPSDTPLFVEHHASASVLCCQLYDMERTLAADALNRIRDLHRIYCCFDSVVEQGNCYKIRGSGSGEYIVAANVAVPNTSHALSLLACAQQLLEACSRIRLQLGRPLQLQLGIHSGELASGLIGLATYNYDIFGETLTTAKMVQVCSVPDRIQVSSSTLALLKGSLGSDWSHRGELHLANGTSMGVWLNRCQQSAPVPAAELLSRESVLCLQLTYTPTGPSRACVPTPASVFVAGCGCSCSTQSCGPSYSGSSQPAEWANLGWGSSGSSCRSGGCCSNSCGSPATVGQPTFLGLAVGPRWQGPARRWNLEFQDPLLEQLHQGWRAKWAISLDLVFCTGCLSFLAASLASYTQAALLDDQPTLLQLPVPVLAPYVTSSLYCLLVLLVASSCRVWYSAHRELLFTLHQLAVALALSHPAALPFRAGAGLLLRLGRYGQMANLVSSAVCQPRFSHAVKLVCAHVFLALAVALAVHASGGSVPVTAADATQFAVVGVLLPLGTCYCQDALSRHAFVKTVQGPAARRAGAAPAPHGKGSKLA